MLEPAVILLRLVQYAAAMLLFGGASFFLYAVPGSRPAPAARPASSRIVLIVSSASLAVASLLGLVAQTAVLAGSLEEGLKASSLNAVISTMALGPSSLIRAAAGALALALIAALRPSRRVFWCASLLGAVALASFAWMGHGAATRGSGGWLHLAADVLHALAAAAWAGALLAFYLLLRQGKHEVHDDDALHSALRRFGTIGTALVLVLVGTGVINSWFLVGPSHLSGLWTTRYGQLLLLKLLLFVGMLVLATGNRFRLTPALGAALANHRPTSQARADLRRSVALETSLALLVLGLVAWLGRLAPVPED